MNFEENYEEGQERLDTNLNDDDLEEVKSPFKDNNENESPSPLQQRRN